MKTLILAAALAAVAGPVSAYCIIGTPDYQTCMAIERQTRVIQEENQRTRDLIERQRERQRRTSPQVSPDLGRRFLEVDRELGIKCYCCEGGLGDPKVSGHPIPPGECGTPMKPAKRKAAR